MSSVSVPGGMGAAFPWSGGPRLPLDHGVIPASVGVKLPEPAGGKMKVFDRIRGSEKSDELKGTGSYGKQAQHADGKTPFSASSVP